MLNHIRGRRIHFAGSADPDIDSSTLSYAHSLIKRFATRVISEGGGLVVTIGAEPTHAQDEDIPLIFDWTILESVSEYQNDSSWPEIKGLSYVAVGLPKWKEKIPVHRKNLWDDVIRNKKLELVQIESGLSVGGVLREKQSSYGDVLVILGGGPGVEHLANLYISKRKPVIPLDIQLRTEKLGAAVQMSIQAMEHPDQFFDYTPPEQAAAAYSTLSLKDNLIPQEEFEETFFSFINNIPKPTAFYVRLLNPESDDYSNVERFFRQVVDPVVDHANYRRFEMMKEATHETFINIEIFRTILASSLVIVDLTGLRPNCLIELGFALGQKKRIVITAQDGTKLPFDTAALPCHFWQHDMNLEQSRKSLQEFIRVHINRNPIE